MRPGPAPLPVGRGARARQKRIEFLRRAIAEGTYRVDAGEVATAILREIGSRRDDR